MNVQDFIRKWTASQGTERSTAQEHFLDLCELLEHPKPREVDPLGEWFTFEKGVEKRGGKSASRQGWADVWKKDFFGWEYKGKHKDLDAARDQLLQYHDSLGNPPLLVVCDIERIFVHTKFTNRPSTKFEISLSALGEPVNLETLRSVFFAPERLMPGETIEIITQKAARHLGEIAGTMQKRGLDSVQVARYLDRVVFCLFAEDIDLLPKGLFSRLVSENRYDAPRVSRLIGGLFKTMSEGGDFGLEKIRHFNGNLFSEDIALDLQPREVEAISDAAKLDWKDVDPSIFGTLFERGLDPAKRAQLGAHYTSREDIESLVEPVVMAELRETWEVHYKTVWERILTSGERSIHKEDKASWAVRSFMDDLTKIRVLDPACGSGNFLYVALQKLKDFEKEIKQWCAERNLGEFDPDADMDESTIARPFSQTIRPEQFVGIEVNPYAFDLAQTTLWIGYLQWLRANGEPFPPEPILRSTQNFLNIDAILDRSEPDNPREPQWPDATYIVGNPPFLGGSRLWEELGRPYQQALWRVWQGRVPGGADLCCYWFEKTRAHIEQNKTRRAGLIATQSIRGGANRQVLKRINESGHIFFAISDRDWINEGANVHVSLVGFAGKGSEPAFLDGAPVAQIHSNLTGETDVTQAKRLSENTDICFIGTKKAGAFNIPESAALQLLTMPNPHGKPNSDVLRPWLNGSAIVQRPPREWIIDAGTNRSEADFALYERPYLHVSTHVRPERATNNRAAYRDKWWIHAEDRPGMRSATRELSRYLATPRVSKHRIFAWFDAAVLPDDGVYIFARDDDYFMGVLHSRLHEVWALMLGTQLEDRPRYTPTTCFETFAFPAASEVHDAAISEAARVLNELRSRWLNPPEWTREEELEFRGSVDGPWRRYVHDADASGIGIVRYPRLVPIDSMQSSNIVKKTALDNRTLTNLYNERPGWLLSAHQKLDEAVFAAYGWNPSRSDEEILAGLLALNQERAA